MILNPWKMVQTLLLISVTVSSSAQTFDVLVTFNGSNGANPASALTQGVDGNLYATTSQGGTNEGGTVFKLTPRGVTVLHSFCSQANCLDGLDPEAALLLASDGNFYGTTVSGGAYGEGTVFKLSPTGELATLYSFCPQTNCPDGAEPYSWLVEGPDGNFYGTTSYGGKNFNECVNFGYSCGTIFRITPEGDLTTLYNFCSKALCSDSRTAYAGLTMGADGNLYGTTVYGGAYSDGTIFEYTPKGRFITLHSFGNNPDGIAPYAGLAQGTDGNLYGTTILGGAYGDGSIFALTISNQQYSTLHSFGRDGSDPYSTPIIASDGKLYGTTLEGGIGSEGTIFSFDLSSSLTTLYSFTGTQQGQLAYGGLFQHTNGVLYGTAEFGGNIYTCDPNNGCGTLFSLDVGLGPFVTFVRDAGRVGQTGGILGQGFIGTTSVMLNGVSVNFTVVSDTFIRATVPSGATTGYVTVTTPTGVLTSNVPFRVIQ